LFVLVTVFLPRGVAGLLSLRLRRRRDADASFSAQEASA
ncbi:MAG: urea ABC transporter permease subunit UrtC, partial [Halomonas sp.]|nr:urea ABC transporter permease subunit UrtC [Halomonas sp.]MDX5503912.1 urea ABC transporter permease subunit UrtC [Halomonas sp.]